MTRLLLIAAGALLVAVCAVWFFTNLIDTLMLPALGPPPRNKLDLSTVSSLGMLLVAIVGTALVAWGALLFSGGRKCAELSTADTKQA